MRQLLHRSGPRQRRISARARSCGFSQGIPGIARRTLPLPFRRARAACVAYIEAFYFGLRHTENFLPKSRVMLMTNTIKFIGCFTLLAGMHPLLAYGIVGFGAAAYSPAKYGILT